MKALSVRQPWADSILAGEKWIEFRSRPTHFRGKLLICASKSGPNEYVEIAGVERALPKGVSLCVVKLINSRPMAETDRNHPGAPDDVSSWYAWEFDDYLDMVIPKPVKGMVNFFEVPDSEIEIAPEGKFWFHYM